MDDRKLKILRMIVDDFIQTAQPIGSRTLVKKYGLDISSATIRNEMADLEELGLLVAPHTSSGRVPSPAGYRLYVDKLMKAKKLNIKERDLIRQLLLFNVIEVDDVINEANRILSNLTNLVSVISLPVFVKSKLENMKLVKISDSKIMMILVSNTKVVKNLTLGVSGIEQDILDKISDTLLSKLKGLLIEDITPKAIYNIKRELCEYSDIIDYLVPILKDTLKEIEEVDVSVDGINNIFNFVEYQNVNKIKEILNNLSDDKFLNKVISSRPETEEINIAIGENTKIKELNDCSIISTTYRFNKNERGVIALIGPMRMDYSNAVSVLDSIRQTLDGIFSGIYL